MVNYDNFLVRCTNKENRTSKLYQTTVNKHLVYENVYANFSPKKVQNFIQQHAINQKKVPKEKKFSVSMLVLDSTSRNQFYR